MATERAVLRTPIGVAYTFVSECVAEKKNQDRAVVVSHDGGCIAVLCDGTAQSMHSAEAASTAVEEPAALWQTHGVGDVAARLREKRARLIADAADPEPDPASFLSRAFAQIRRDARQCAFQTTFVTARISPADDGRVAVEAKTVGDSAILVFGADGRLDKTNLPVPESGVGFGHTTFVTEVLPDHYTTDEAMWRMEIDTGAQVVLCSDGFYDAFASPCELRQWLEANRSELQGEALTTIVETIHERLDKRVGDDDVSFIWFCPRLVPEREAAPAPTVKSALVKHSRFSRRVAVPVAWLRRVFGPFLGFDRGDEAS